MYRQRLRRAPNTLIQLLCIYTGVHTCTHIHMSIHTCTHIHMSITHMDTHKSKYFLKIKQCNFNSPKKHKNIPHTTNLLLTTAYYLCLYNCKVLHTCLPGNKGTPLTCQGHYWMLNMCQIPGRDEASHKPTISIKFGKTVVTQSCDSSSRNVSDICKCSFTNLSQEFLCTNFRS